MSSLRLETRIDRVTVYRNGALVTRTGALEVAEALPAPLLIPGLPLLFSSDSLRVRPGGGLTVGPVEEEAQLGTTAERRGADALEREALQAEREALQAEQKAWKTLEEFYGRLSVPEQPDLPREAAPLWPDTALWAALTDLADEGRAQVDRARRTLREKLRDVEARLKRVERQIAAVPEGDRARYTRALRTTLRGAATGPVPFEVEYFVTGARWAPSYTLDLAGEGAADLRMSAHIAQATGEDWIGAEIRVATSDLRRDTALPKLAAWKIGRATSPSSGGWRPLPEDLDGLFADADRAAAARPGPPPRPEPPPQRPEGQKSGKARAAVEGAADVAFFGVPAPKALSVSVQGTPSRAPSPPQAPEMALLSASAPMQRHRAVATGMDRPSLEAAAPPSGGRPPGPPPPPLAPAARLLDYAWLRLPDWTERGRRGRLFPVDAFADLKALAEERGDPSRYLEADRALDALRTALNQLGRAPLPPGCTAPDDASNPWVSPPGPRVDVAADGRFHQVSILAGQGLARALFRAVPRQAPQVFRYARLPNPLGAPLPTGPLRVTLDGDFCANAAVRSVGASSVLLLNLGVEEGVRIARNVTFAEAEKGVLSSTTVVTHQVKIEVRSRLSTPATLQIFERLPLAPEGSDLSVTLEQASLPPTRDLDAADEAAPGALRWEITIPPGQKADLSWQYAVRVPARMEVVGGNRRES